MIEIKGLQKYYGSQKVLNIPNLEFKKGKIYGIVGANGAGKTTLFECISGLETYDGEIKYNRGTLKNELGFLQTEPFFFKKITGYEYLKFICNARKIKLDQIEEKNIFDLPLDKYASRYSTGMKKKLALMGVLLQQNEVFIFDEPFNGVDLEGNLLITEILLELKKQNKIILLASHFFSTLKDCCDVLFLLEKGKIVKKVTPEDFYQIENELKTTSLDRKLFHFRKFYH